jgi:CHAT domain-containing protein
VRPAASSPGQRVKERGRGAVTAPAPMISEPARAGLVAAFHRLATVAPVDPQALPGLEAALDALYSLAAAEDNQDNLRRLQALVADHAGRHPAIDAWLALTGLSLSDTASSAPALAAVDAALADAPPWTRLLVGAEAARLVWRRDGTAPGWRRLAASDTEAAFKAVSPLNDLQRDSSMILSAVCTTLDLAALNGAWSAHEKLAQAASAMWPAHHLSAVRIALLVADAAITRGNYLDALHLLSPLVALTRGDLRMHLFCTKLHALVALGKDTDPDAEEAFKAFCETLKALPEAGHELPAEDRRALEARVQQLVTSTAALRHLAEDAAFTSSPVETTADTFATTLPRLLQREQAARRVKNAEKRVRALLSVLQDAEDLMTRPEATASPEGWIRLRLLWCRTLVDLMLLEMFEVCEQMLDGLIEEAHRLGFAPLEMLALDQRAVLRSRKSPIDWQGALLDSSAAAQLAMKQLAQNAESAFADKGIERSLLESLLPVLDRVIEIHAEGAVRVTERHPELLSCPLGKIDATLLDEDSPRGTWLRFGRVLHRYAEQSQALALEEARRAYEDGRTLPHRFAVAGDGAPSIILDRLCSDLRPEDGVLQYFVVSRYVFVFAYGRDFFDWSIRVIDDTESAEKALEELLHELRPWIQGDDASEHVRAVARLHALLLPKTIVTALKDARVHHLRIVPHAALYRVPFGRLAPDSAPLLHHFSLSLHPTGQLAAESAKESPVKLRRRPLLGYVIGPENEAGATADLMPRGIAQTGLAPMAVRCAEREEQALRRGAGAIAPILEVQRVDGVTLNLKEITSRMTEFRLLHFTCHGREGGEYDQKPSLMLGSERGVGLEPSAIVKMKLHGCALVLLQSCSTGWMDHKRSNPVQGLPQAFCDAGARAVIAPLTKVPKALAPIFSNVFYRALRFLPAEKALGRALSVLRAHGSALVAADPEAEEAFVEHGSTMDGFEYRYTGATGLALGGFVSRCVGRLSFFWFEWRLRRAGKPAWTPRRSLVLNSE